VLGLYSPIECSEQDGVTPAFRPFKAVQGQATGQSVLSSRDLITHTMICFEDAMRVDVLGLEAMGQTAGYL
jgi:hypothetical protein